MDVVETIPIMYRPEHITVSPDGDRVYVSTPHGIAIVRVGKKEVGNLIDVNSPKGIHFVNN